MQFTNEWTNQLHVPFFKVGKENILDFITDFLL